MAENQEPAKVEEKGPFIHQLQLFLVGGQQFTINELSDSPKMPQNVIAFINAWRQKRDVWHSPNNDPKYGVREKESSHDEHPSLKGAHWTRKGRNLFRKPKKPGLCLFHERRNQK